MTLDPDDPTPLRDQIAAILRARILTGDIGPGEQIPAVIPMSRLHHISTQTVLDAYTILREEGLVITTNQGTFVRKHNRPRMVHLLIPADADTETLREWVSEHLGLSITSTQADTMRALLNGNPNRGLEQR